MSGFLTAVIIISAIFIVFAVIMQPSKDGGLGGLASGGVTDSVFGTNRNEFLSKATWWLMAIFLVSSIVLAKHKTREHNEKEAAINTRSQAEEISDQKVAPAIEDAKDKAESLKEDAKAAEGKIETTVEEIKKQADAIKEDAEKTVEDVKKDADAEKDKAEDAVKDLKNSLPKAE